MEKVQQKRIPNRIQVLHLTQCFKGTEGMEVPACLCKASKHPGQQFRYDSMAIILIFFRFSFCGCSLVQKALYIPSPSVTKTSSWDNIGVPSLPQCYLNIPNKRSAGSGRFLQRKKPESSRGEARINARQVGLHCGKSTKDVPRFWGRGRGSIFAVDGRWQPHLRGGVDIWYLWSPAQAYHIRENNEHMLNLS